VYWRIRFEPSPGTGVPDRVLVCYKDTKGGGLDPNGPTGTWRDPAGANRPENALIGEQYVGDKFDTFYPLVVSAAEGKDRVYRYTPLQSQPAGSSTSIGQSLIGWEWDARASNGSEPAGVKTLATSPVNGNIEQNYGNSYTVGPAVSNVVKYTAPSGALVFATGTNHWDRGLAYNADGVGEPDLRIQQITANVFADMNVLPQTPSAGLQFDASAKPPAPTTVTASQAGTSSITVSWSAVSGADGYHVYRTTAPRTNGQPVGARANATMLTGTTFTDTGLNPSTTYYYVVETVAGANLSAPSVEASATTASLPAPTVTATTPADGATGVNPAATVRATFSRGMDATTLTSSSYTLLAPDGTQVPAAVTYDSTTNTAILTPNAALAFSARYTAQLAGTVRATDGTSLAAPVKWAFTTAAQPSPPPTVTAISPTNGATNVPRDTTVRLTFSRAMDASTLTTTSLTLRTSTGTVVAANVSYDTATTTAVLTPTQALTGGATYTVRLEATVAAADGTPVASAQTWTFTTSACPCSLFPTQQPASQPGGTFEVGVKIKVDQPLALTSLRFYKSSQETGTHVGTIWTAGGTQIERVPFVSETAAGWQQQALPMPIQLQPNVVYVVSVNTNSHYVVTTSALQTAVNAGPLHTVADGANGVYNNTVGVFPTSSFSSSNYFVDVVVSNVPVPLVATALTPAAGATGVQFRPTVRALFSKPLDATTVTSSNFTLQDASGASVPASVTYDSATNAATLSPAAQLGAGVTYTARLGPGLRAADGSALSGTSSWSFTTVSCPCSLFSSVSQPPLFPNGRFELGVKIKVDQPLAITTLRFYKAPGETGSHIGTVWSASGVMLGRVTFANETASGWQSQALPTAVQLQANTTYVVSVNANTQYPAASGGLQSEVAYGPLHTVADGANGVYNDTPGNFPSQTYNSTNYYVDVVVDRVTVPFSVTSASPASGATNVQVGTTVRATFSKQVDSATLNGSSFTLRDAAGTQIPATVSYDGASSTATLTPSAPLSWSKTYTATLAGTVAATDGSTLGSAYSWSFSTVSCPCSLFSSVLQPAQFANGRFELGVKLKADQAMTLTAIRFFKSSQETGTHTASVWSSAGVRLASVTFSGETASGWQEQALATPLSIQAGVTYVVSVNVNASYAVTLGGLQNEIVSGPLRTIADGANGVYSDTLGAFPSQSYNSSNYFVDVVVR
jgi:fibronectin type 3 domain-containing protein